MWNKAVNFFSGMKTALRESAEKAGFNIARGSIASAEEQMLMNSAVYNNFKNHPITQGYKGKIMGSLKNPDSWHGLNSLSESFGNNGPKNLKHWFSGRNYSAGKYTERNYGRAAARIGTVAGLSAMSVAPGYLGANAVNNWWNGR